MRTRFGNQVTVPDDKMAAPTWTEDREVQLIELWQTVPCLYKAGHRHYSNKTVKSWAYIEVATAMNCEGKRMPMLFRND